MKDEDFIRIAKLLRKYFDDVRGWVITDIVSGIALVNGMSTENSLLMIYLFIFNLFFFNLLAYHKFRPKEIRNLIVSLGK